MSCPICQKEHPYTIPEALANLAKTPRRLQRLASRIGPGLGAARPAPEKWSAKEIICHVADCEIVFGFRYRKILAEPGSTLAAFDQQAWANNLGYRSQSLKPVLSSFASVRGSNLALLKSLPEQAWDRSGQHAEYGELTLRQLVLHLAYHDRNHTGQVEKLLSAAARPAEKASQRR
jgi:uncharacterized damage-inducible protein DinB